MNFPETDEFLSALAAKMPAEERLILCGFPEEPDYAQPSSWKPRPWSPGKDLCYDLGILDKFNAYVTVASFNRAEDNSFRRRGACFASGLALMVDDLGDGAGSKVTFDVIAGLPPSALVETSPGNHEAWFFLDEPCRDAARFDGIIRAFISGKLLGADTGMSGITRVGRLAGYTNNKKKYGGNFKVALKSLTDKRYSIEDLLKAFDLKINGQRIIREKLQSEEAIERNRMFAVYYKWLQQHGMLKRDEPDLSGWTEARCPFAAGHTGGVDNGAAICEPNPTNAFFGGWRCHHGSCLDRGFAELTDWINDQSIEELQEANKWQSVITR